MKISIIPLKKKNSLDVIWHPERYLKLKNFDINLFKIFYAINTISSR